MYFLDNDGNYNSDVLKKVDDLVISYTYIDRKNKEKKVDKSRQIRIIVDILKKALETENLGDLKYKILFSYKRVLYQILKDSDLEKNIELRQFLKEITEEFIKDLETIEKSKIYKLKKAYRNVLDLLIIKSLEIKK